MKKGIRVRQRDITDCGAACLASVAARYGYHLPLARIRQYAGTDTKGTNIAGLVEAAERMGFEVKAGKGGVDNLAKIPLPAIAHVVLKNGLQHYVVIDKVSRHSVRIMDPAFGHIRKKKMEIFAREWSGVLVLLLPATGFQKKGAPASNAARFWQLIWPHRGIMTLALAGAMIVTVLGLSTAIYMQKLIDIVLVEGNARLLNLLSVLMIILVLFQLFISAFKTVLGLQVGQHIDAQLILGYYRHLLRLPQRFFDTMRVGEIISRVNDAVKIRHFVNEVVLNLVVNILVVFFSITLMFLYYWKLALVMLAIIPFYLLLYGLTDRINSKWQRVLMEESASLETQLVESLNAAGTIKRLGLETYADEKTESRFVALLKRIYGSSIKSMYAGTASAFFTRISAISVLWAGSYFVMDRELTPGELLSFYALIEYFTGPATALIGANKDIREALIAADRLFEIIDLETESGNTGKVNIVPAMAGDICFQDICFRYGTRGTVFEGLSLTIPKGSCTAIAGESGSGKSTLLALLQQLYPLQQGRITIGGLDISQVSNSSLRKLVSVVPQQVDLFAGTILENISIGDADPDIKRVLFLGRLLGIDEFAEQMPAGYNSRINEQGSNLSGGQKQRIALARALYRNPEILMLDEATAALDPASEQKVMAALHWFGKEGKTVIIIAHRLATVRNCDLIHVLHKGKLVETGTHHRLLGLDGYYKKIMY